jgi:malonate decarboxylase beta subunit
MDRFSNAGAGMRVEGILDAGSFEPLAQNRTTTITGAGRLSAAPVWIAATDPMRARGALGRAEADALCMLFQAARRERRPLLLLLDSAGANVDEGLAGLGAFRRLFHELLLTRAAGVPMLALLGKSCFGGASMLACVCNARVYSSETLLAVSGPAVIEALSGKAELDASDRSQVRSLMGGEARARLGGEELLCADRIDAFGVMAVDWLRSGHPILLGPDTTERHHRLRRRLEGLVSDTGVSAQDRQGGGFERLIPATYASTSRGVVSVALPPHGSDDPAYLGVVTGSTVGAQACWTLADELLSLHRSNPASPVVLVLDVSGHASTQRDEALMLSAYLTHLSMVAAELVVGGQRPTLWIPGAAAGAVYVAFAAPSERVLALPTARIRILPEAAVRQIVGAKLEEPSDPDALLRAGVIDALLEHRPAVATSRRNAMRP